MANPDFNIPRWRLFLTVFFNVVMVFALTTGYATEWRHPPPLLGWLGAVPSGLFNCWLALDFIRSVTGKDQSGGSGSNDAD